MLAIGIDPGTAICGFGLVEMIGNRAAAGTLRRSVYG